ncbi:zinc carboxypeptidase family protein (macronuclear) [Tetrahymena thermophila SB210]|uniref:Zinc carboxypeptidase family protein n=1 Tax=Tetrahymena thermophila (strain SB210) TaxID=312017 RepID=Q22DY2_TETTS|nr:zinc carboxypeptidase family protein [Tetrahymena thermophila SB210]EAR83530.2 zinc carboxypeptidase family protein [Tetrahymena thermophila SB210]|eukprot:XP_001031193.2 zinc carboxypeptidase family protein [Tetrahymena thermophila SB210]
MDVKYSEQMLKCPKHLGFKLEFIQVNNLPQNYEKDILYCCCCQDEDESYQQKNFILIHKLIDEGNQKILSKWPPLNNDKILQSLINESKDQDIQSSLIQQINSFFDQLIQDFLFQVDQCKKRMINYSLKQYKDSYILEKYQEISKILDLRNTLLEDKTDVHQKQAKCKQIIKQMIEAKDQNTKVISQLLNQHIDAKNQINYDYPSIIKKSILNLVDQINFFCQQDCKQSKNHDYSDTKIQIEQQNIFVDQIVSLISTKSNFCSDKFTQKFKIILNQIHPLLDQLNNIELFQPNKKPIDFQLLRDYDLDIIRNQVFDLEKKQLNQQPITFNQTNFNNDKQIISITKNQSISIKATTDSNYPGQCVSNIILDKEQKYIFRFKILCNVDRTYFDIGMVRDTEKDRDGFIDCLTYSLLYSNGQVSKSPFSSLSKPVKGKDLIVKTDSQQIEVRVSLQDKIFEIVNYPNYDCKLQIDDYYKKNLNYHNLRLFIQTKSKSLEIILADVFNIDSFQE